MGESMFKWNLVPGSTAACHGTLQPQEGKDADLSMLANAKRDSHNNVVFVKWQGLARNLGRQAHIDDDMGIKWAMNTIPLHPFAEPEWQMVHPAIGTVMRRIKEVSHGKIAKHGALVQQRPRVRDDIIRLSQIWSVALALHNNRDNPHPLLPPPLAPQPCPPPLQRSP